MANGIRSLANPGSTPEMKRLELPCCAACSMGAMYLSGMTPHGYWNTPGDVPTTLTPADRMRRTSVTASGIRLSPIAQYTAQSGLVASRASRSLVAMMPVEVVEPGELACVLADLGVRGHPDAGQFEAGIADQMVERDTSPHCPCRYVRRGSPLLSPQGRGWTAVQLIGCDPRRTRQVMGVRTNPAGAPIPGISWSAGQLSSTPAGAITAVGRRRPR